MSYKETFSSESPNLGRINTNDTLRSLVTTGYGETPPTQYITTDGVNGPFTGQLWYSSNSQSYGLHVNSPDHAQDSIHPNSFTRNGVASRIANSYANLVKDHANSLYELGECVVIINSDPNHSANNTLYFINGTTGAESELVDVGQTSLSDGSVNESHLATGAVTTIKIQNGAVTGPKIASSAVDASKLASDSVTTSKVQNGAITNPKLADSSVSTNKIQNGAVTGSKIATNAVTSDKIPASAITEAKIGSGAVTSAKIPINELTGSKLVANTIGTREMNITGPDSNGAIVVDDGAGGMTFVILDTNLYEYPPPSVQTNWVTRYLNIAGNTKSSYNISFNDFNYLDLNFSNINVGSLDRERYFYEVLINNARLYYSSAYVQEGNSPSVSFRVKFIKAHTVVPSTTVEDIIDLSQSSNFKTAILNSNTTSNNLILYSSSFNNSIFEYNIGNTTTHCNVHVSLSDRGRSSSNVSIRYR